MKPCERLSAAAVGAIAMMACPSQAQPDNPPTIVAFEIPGVADASGDQPYDQILQKASQSAGLSLKFHYLPAARAKSMFLQNQTECYFPFDPKLFTEVDPQRILLSKNFNIAKSYIFTRKGDAPLSQLEQATHLRIGARWGLTYGSLYEQVKHNPQWHIEQVQDDRTNFRKLQERRLDVMLAYLPDLYAVLSPQELAQLQYQAEAPLTMHRDAIACHDNSRNRGFLESFNTGMEKLESSGERQRILGKLYLSD